jgi:hypothetical protein
MPEPVCGIRGWVIAAAVLVSACGGEELASGTGPASEGVPQPEASLHTGYIVHPDGSARRIAYEVRGGLAIIEGDIVVGPAEEVATTAEAAVEQARQLGALSGALGGTTKRWPNGIVYYYIDPSISFPSAVTAAMEHIEYWSSYVWDGASSSVYIGAPRIDFRPWQSGVTEYIWIKPTGTGCNSYVGRVSAGNYQVVSLDYNCQTKGIAIHELGHALGLQHEQNRCDRDSYIWVYDANILPDWRPQFTLQCSGYRLVAEYDEGSVMHYQYDSASANGNWTMESKRGRTYEMGSGMYTNHEMSWNDVYSVQWMYGGNYGKTASGGPYTLRTGPGSTYASAGTIAGNTRVNITCQTTGTSTSGPWGSTNVWNKLSNGSWIADAVVFTGTTNKYVSARCQ